jgi:hypothetical protein
LRNAADKEILGADTRRNHNCSPHDPNERSKHSNEKQQAEQLGFHFPLLLISNEFNIYID